MILLDTGPMVALFDPRDGDHRDARGVLERIREPLVVTLPVLTEAFHLLGPGSQGSRALRDFLRRGGARSWFFDDSSLGRALDLMDRYADHPMDLADASVVVAAEALKIQRVFTLDRNDFASYRIRWGRSHRAFQLVT
jgi:predicted nucleic acid-binding protein